MHGSMATDCNICPTEQEQEQARAVHVGQGSESIDSNTHTFIVLLYYNKL
jgi:hypothetical protein